MEASDDGSDEPKVIIITDTDKNQPSASAVGDVSYEAVDGRIEQALRAFNEAHVASLLVTCSCPPGGELDYANAEECQTNAVLPGTVDGLTECERAAARCHTEQFEAYYACLTQSSRDLRDCFAECPNFDEYFACWGITVDAEERCGANAQALHDAQDDCAVDGVLDECKPIAVVPDPEPEPESCSSSFANEVASDEEYWRKVFTIKDDNEFVDSCYCYGRCIVHSIDFRTDGSYYQNWSEQMLCSTWHSTTGPCEWGTWEVTGCNQLRMTNCKNQETIGIWTLDDGDLVIDAAWVLDNETMVFTQRYRNYSRVDGEAWGLRNRDCGHSVCD